MSCDLTSTSFHSNIGKKRYYGYFLYLMSLVGKKSITCDFYNCIQKCLHYIWHVFAAINKSV